jgi:hypothetical protein
MPKQPDYARLFISPIRYALANSACTAEQIADRLHGNGISLDGDEVQRITNILLSREGRPSVVHYDGDTRRFHVLPHFQWGSERALTVGGLLIQTLDALQLPLKLSLPLYGALVKAIQHVYEVADRRGSNPIHYDKRTIKIELPSTRTDEESAANEAFRGVFKIVQGSLIEDLRADPELARRFVRMFTEAQERLMTLEMARAVG